MMATNLLVDTARLQDVSKMNSQVNRARKSVRDEGGLDRITALGLDSYRIALIAPAVSGAEDSSVSRPGAERLVIVPLTWKQFVGEVRKRATCASTTDEQESAQFGDVSVDFNSMEVRRSNQNVKLTALEFKVLRFFVLNPRKVISREDLLNQVWGYDTCPCTRTVDILLSKLRQKLESDVARPVHFRTVRGIGYKFVP